MAKDNQVREEIHYERIGYFTYLGVSASAGCGVSCAAGSNYNGGAETGGSLDENEAHVTSSTLRIYMPADSKDIAACDYIQLVENDIVIFAGTVMEAEQENLDNVDLSYKIYNLTLTNNSD